MRAALRRMTKADRMAIAAAVFGGREEDPSKMTHTLRRLYGQWRAEERRKAERRFVGVDSEYAAILRCDPCAYCGQPASDADHMDSVRRGGAGTWDNLTAACRSCNSRKGSKTLLEFLSGTRLRSSQIRIRRRIVEKRLEPLTSQLAYANVPLGSHSPTTVQTGSELSSLNRN